jgi:hypothetical protein
MILNRYSNPLLISLIFHCFGILWFPFLEQKRKMTKKGKRGKQF